MRVQLKQISSLEKFANYDSIPSRSIKNARVFANEVLSYQLIVSSKERVQAKITIESPIKDYVELYAVKDVFMDFPAYEESDDDFITKETGTMPDLLIPLEEQNNIIKFNGDYAVIWVKVKLPESVQNGKYSLTLNVEGEVGYKPGAPFKESAVMEIEKIKGVLPEQELIYTQWFHTDCIATSHNVEIYSEEHWELIDKYMKLASSLGINMILTPVITPPLDTAEGHRRPCTQLVKVYYTDKKYSFDFTLLKRWVSYCKKNNIKYYEISHLFSQWGLHKAPGILVNENNNEVYKFGWHVDANSQEYKEFLSAFLPALVEELKKEEIFDKCYFHLSDEPKVEDLERYEYAFNLVKPFVEDRPIMDAISDIDFYNKGYITTPVTATDYIEPFLKKGSENQWAYYCCSQDKEVSNRFMAMPSYRTGIIGLQLYKFDIKGFLHWGFNFYYSHLSLYPINPYITSSAEKAWPSGDPFSVYPGRTGPLPSLRSFVFYEGLQDIRLLKMLEEKIGKKQTLELIEEEAKMEITFKSYPKSAEFLLKLRERLKDEILR